jgi:hypothetical protein
VGTGDVFLSYWWYLDLLHSYYQTPNYKTASSPHFGRNEKCSVAGSGILEADLDPYPDFRLQQCCGSETFDYGSGFGFSMSSGSGAISGSYF